MSYVFLILIILVSVILAFIVLVQNPKGGGLAGSLAGISNQFMGVKQTTDVLEKGTWICGTIIAVLCICSTFFVTGASATPANAPTKGQNAPIPAGSVPANPAPAGGQNAVPFAQPTTPDSTK